MRTLFLYTLQIYLFCSCTCILGVLQPRPDHDSSSTFSYVEKTFKKCQELNVDISKSNFLNPDNLLCFGLNVLSQRFRGGLGEPGDSGGVEQNSHICEHFHEMRVNSTQDELNDFAVIYNLQFRNKETCERACLDVMSNVNPLCSVILWLSHYPKGNPIVSGNRAPSNTLPDYKGDNDNEVSTQSRKFVNDVLNRSSDGQKTKGSDVGQVNVEIKTVSSTQEKTIKRQKLHEGGKSVRQETATMHQTPQGRKSPSTDDVGKLHEQTQQTDARKVDSVEGKPKATNEEMTHTTETKGQPFTSALPGENGGIIPDKNSAKEATNSKEESKVSDTEDISLVVDNNNEGISDTSLKTEEMAMSSVVLPLNTGDIKNEQVTAARPKIQGKTGTVKDKLTAKEVVTNTDLKEEESISQVPNVEEVNDIVSGENSQTDKETENALHKDGASQINNKRTEVTAKSNTDERKTNQNNGKAHTNESATIAPQVSKSDTETMSNDGHATGDEENGLKEPKLHISGEADKNVNVGPVLIPGRDYDDDDDSHFFAYFMTTMVFCIVGYLLFHNKQKILALALEGRARRGRRRPNTSGYRKLDSNLEEAISSSKSASVTQVIY